MAEEQALDMFTFGYIGHDREEQPGRPAEKFRKRLKRFNLLDGWTTEFLAEAGNLKEAFQIWKADPAVVDLIRNPNFTSYGIANKENLYVLCMTSL